MAPPHAETLRPAAGAREVRRFPKGHGRAFVSDPRQCRGISTDGPGAFAAGDTYSGLKMPVSIIARDDDRLVNSDVQSTRLHRDIPQSSFDRAHGAGHMVHQTATDAVMSAIEEVTSLEGPLRKPEAE